MAKSFKVEVLAYGETKYVSNALRFQSREWAELYGVDLASRWTMVEKWRVAESDDEPNRMPQTQEV